MSENTDKAIDASISKIKKNLPKDESIGDLADLFKLFGDSTRLKILYSLLSSELCVNDISGVLNMSPSAVSHQLKTLKTNKLIKNRRKGKTIYYSLDDHHVGEIINIGMSHLTEDEKNEK